MDRFSNFEFLRSIDKNIYEKITIAEKNALINFSQCGNNCRQALETFVNKIIAKNNSDVYGNLSDEDLYIKLSSLRKRRLIPDFNKVCCKIKSGENSSRKTDMDFYDFLRKFGNACSHSTLAPGDPIVCFENTIMCLSCCHKLFSSSFRASGVRSFDPNRIPINNYYVQKSFVPRDSARSNCKREYFCCSFKHASDSVEKYAVIRRYEKECINESFLLRNHDTFMQASRKAISGVSEGMTGLNTIVGLDNDQSSFYIIAHEFFYEPKLLDRGLLDKVSIPQRLEMCRVIASCINNLHNLENPIYHRMLTYDSIVVCEIEHRFIPYVIKFDYSKITSSETVRMILNKTRADMNNRERSLQKYLAPEWRSVGGSADVSGETWKRIDIYSLGILFCDILVGRFDYKEVTEKDLSNLGLSDRLTDVLLNMTSEMANERGELSDVIAAIDTELRK